MTVDELEAVFGEGVAPTPIATTTSDPAVEAEQVEDAAGAPPAEEVNGSERSRLSSDLNQGVLGGRSVAFEEENRTALLADAESDQFTHEQTYAVEIARRVG